MKFFNVRKSFFPLSTSTFTYHLTMFNILVENRTEFLLSSGAFFVLSYGCFPSFLFLSFYLSAQVYFIYMERRNLYFYTLSLLFIQVFILPAFLLKKFYLPLYDFWLTGWYLVLYFNSSIHLFIPLQLLRLRLSYNSGSEAYTFCWFWLSFFQAFRQHQRHYTKHTNDFMCDLCSVDKVLVVRGWSVWRTDCWTLC